MGLTPQSVGTAATVITAYDEWYFIAVSKAVGTVAPRFHQYRYSTNAWSHEDGNNTIGDGASPGADGNVRLGQDGDLGFGDGQYLLAAVWNRALSDAETELLPYSLQAWYASAPVGGWLLDQSLTTQNVIDWTGGEANQSSITGTAVSAFHPPVFNRYGWVPLPGRLAAAPAGILRQMLLHHGG